MRKINGRLLNNKHNYYSKIGVYEELYRKRIIVEHFFSWIKKNAKLTHIYEKTIKSFRGILLLAVSIIITRRIS